MTLINLKCNGCGGDITMDDTKEAGFCMYCGNKFLIKDELVRIAVQHSGSVDINRKQEAENLMIRANQKVDKVDATLKNEVTIKKRSEDICSIVDSAVHELHDISSSYIDRVLDLDPDNESAKRFEARIIELIDNYKSINKNLFDEQSDKGMLKLTFILAAILGVMLLWLILRG